MKIDLNIPIKVGDHIFTTKRNPTYFEKYMCCEYVVEDVEIHLDPNGEVKQILYKLNDNDNCWHIYGPGVCFTKEEFFELFRKDLEQLISPEMREYLWNK